jgi:hypothetical protein
MKKNIFVELFQFDAKMDYNPYYRKKQTQIDTNTTLLDILNNLNNDDEFGYKDKDNFGLRANTLFTTASTKVVDVLKDDTLVIEPLSIRRAIKDLIIDTKDFDDKLELVDDFINKSTKQQIKDLYLPLYYASNTLNHNHEYIGDHLLLTIYDLIQDNEEYKSKLVRLLENEDYGIVYHTSLEKRLFPYDDSITEKINQLFSYCDLPKNLSQHYGEFFPPVEIKQSFEGFKIGVYGSIKSSSIFETIINAKGKYKEYCSKYYDIPFFINAPNKNFLYKLAGDILLDAVDNNIDFMLVEDKTFLELFDKEQKKIKCSVGREINLPIISTEQFSKLASGEKDIKTLGFDTHKVKINFL